MRLLLVSDSHGRDANVRKAIEKESPIDALIHLGDSLSTEERMQKLAGCPVYMVAGNCDYFTDLPMTRVVKFGKQRMFLTHGHSYFVSVGTGELVEAARKMHCSVAVFGHIHCPVWEAKGDDLLLLNPGSISQPRQPDRKASYMVMEIDEQGEAKVCLKYL